ncbi:hypothetical protein LTR15_001533 [Elasticomyces elasticus]|nr:hypothetical protein LTR15_001533 [Elasticomyces elasticus]
MSGLEKADQPSFRVSMHPPFAPTQESDVIVLVKKQAKEMEAAQPCWRSTAWYLKAHGASGALINLASKAYQGWKKACGEYADVTASLDNLLIILTRIESETAKPESILVRSVDDATDLTRTLASTLPTVRELNGVVKQYKSLSLGKSREKNWDRIRFGIKDLTELRLKLNQHVIAITACLETVGLGALSRIERGLETLPQIKHTIDALAADIRAGRREASVLTTYDDDDKEVWRQFRRELIGEGMRGSTIHKYKPQIKDYLRTLAGTGLLEEDALGEDE